MAPYDLTLSMNSMEEGIHQSRVTETDVAFTGLYRSGGFTAMAQKRQNDHAPATNAVRRRLTC